MNSQGAPLVLIGAGGHALEVAQLVDDINASAANPVWNLLGCVVEPVVGEAVAAQRDGLPPLLGDLDWLQSRPDVAVVLAVGDCAARARLMHALPAEMRSPILVHPRAWIAPRASLGPGTVAFAFAAVNAGARIGAHVILNLGSTVSHDCVVGDACSLGPGCHLPGGVQVGAGCDLGAGSTARPRSSIGAGSVVGAGAAVVANLPPQSRAGGVPAQELRRKP